MFNSLLNSSLAGIISQFQSIWSVAFRSSTLRHDTVAIFLVLFFVLPVVPFGGGGGGLREWYTNGNLGSSTSLAGLPLDWEAISNMGNFRKSLLRDSELPIFFPLCAKGGRFCRFFFACVNQNFHFVSSEHIFIYASNAVADCNSGCMTRSRGWF